MLRDKLQSDQTSALKSGDKLKLSVVRYILAQVKNKEIEKKEPLNDEEVMAVLRKQIKELKESIDAFEKGNRPELAAEYKAQYEIVASYMPPELTDEQITAEINRIKEANKAAYEKNPKLLIGLCMKELRGKADPGRIMKLLQSVA